MADAKIRLYVEHPLGEGQTVPLTRDQAHYLFGVMRLGAGDPVLVFNGEAGEWLAEVEEAGKRGGLLRCTDQTAPQRRSTWGSSAIGPVSVKRSLAVLRCGRAVAIVVTTAFWR